MCLNWMLRSHLEDESLLTSVWQRELDLPIEAPRTKERGVKRVGAVGGHNDLQIGGRIREETVRTPLHEK